MPKIQPYLYGNDGNIIMVQVKKYKPKYFIILHTYCYFILIINVLLQYRLRTKKKVENEYGGYYACDLEYKLWLRDLTRSYVQNKAVLYTTDACGQSYFNCGPIPEVFATVDFGPYSNGLYNVIMKFTKL